MNIEEYESTLGSSPKKQKRVVVGVVGSRRRNSSKDIDLLESYVLSLIAKSRRNKIDLIFVSGGCYAGADLFIENLAIKYSLSLVVHKPSELTKGYHEKVKAYYARNKKIAEDCDFLIAMVAPDRKGGTENTINYCKEMGKKVIII